MPGALDPRSYDPRKVMDQQHVRDQVQRLQRAQAIARAQAQATSTVFLATIVSLATSAFGVVAALAWNDAIQAAINDLVKTNAFFTWAHGNQTLTKVLYAVIATVLAVFVILTLNRVAARIAKKSAIDAAQADAGNV
jgi:hypothetical protein